MLVNTTFFYLIMLTGSDLLSKV